jgi:hypothetical protein
MLAPLRNISQQCKMCTRCSSDPSASPKLHTCLFHSQGRRFAPASKQKIRRGIRGKRTIRWLSLLSCTFPPHSARSLWSSSRQPSETLRTCQQGKNSTAKNLLLSTILLRSPRTPTNWWLPWPQNICRRHTSCRCLLSFLRQFLSSRMCLEGTLRRKWIQPRPGKTPPCN